MVCGTGSDVGKTHVVTGLCRLWSRRGISVAPFKAQNMALNSYVTASGHEIGRAQGIQALAAGCEPEVAMNPILLKPTGERTSQVVVMGRPTTHMEAVDYHAEKPRLFETARAALADLRSRFDVIVLEGAGSAAEINLLDHDLVNLRLAEAAGVPAVVVGDIDRGGVFASLYGTVALLPQNLRAVVAGFIVNKFRGDPDLLGDATAELERRCGVPTLGIVPWLHDVALDAEDSLALGGRPPRPTATALGVDGDTLDVAVVQLPRIANFTDFDALALEPNVGLRFVTGVAALGRPDLVIVPGTKATVADLAWLRRQGLDRAIPASGAEVLGICGGYQMMGRTISDGVESGAGHVTGLGWLDVTTRFHADKITRRRRGTGMPGAGDAAPEVEGYEIRHGHVTGGSGQWIRLEDRCGTEVLGICGGYQMMGRTISDGVESGVGQVAGLGWLDVNTRFHADKITRRRRGTGMPGAGDTAPEVEGYEIRHGRVTGGSGQWIRLDDRYGTEVEGARSADGSVRGTSLHGLFESDGFRSAFLAGVAQRRGRRFVASGVSFGAAREAQIDRLADALEEHLDEAALEAMVESAAEPSSRPLRREARL